MNPVPWLELKTHVPDSSDITDMSDTQDAEYLREMLQ